MRYVGIARMADNDADSDADIVALVINAIFL
jgi:hypothetical protein